jgi:phosphohistidine phosphatase SixA
MRHPSSPLQPPEKSAADPRNTTLERELDETGKSSARAMGDAMRSLHIPVGEIFSSPTFRALEAIRLAGLGKPRIAAELNEGAHGMQSNTEPKHSAWLKNKTREVPRKGTNTILVTHTPNLIGAFGNDIGKVAAGEALVFHPDGKGSTELVARVKIEEWPQLATASESR